MQSRVDRVIPLCERRNENAPGCWNPRAFAWPREIGVTDLRDAKGSVDVGGALVIPLAAFGQKRIAPFARAQARIALGRWQQCSDVEGMRHGIRVFEESPQGEVAHLTRAFFVWQQNFYITDERRNSCRPAASNIRRVHFDSMHCIKCVTVVYSGHEKARIVAGFSDIVAMVAMGGLEPPTPAL